MESHGRPYGKAVAVLLMPLSPMPAALPYGSLCAHMPSNRPGIAGAFEGRGAMPKNV